MSSRKVINHSKNFRLSEFTIISVPDLKDFCKCGNCSQMSSIEESVCCQSFKRIGHDGKTFLSVHIFTLIFQDLCVLNNCLVDMILKSEILEVNLR